VREDNWTPLYDAVRKQEDSWLNRADPDGPFALFPALNPNDLFPYDASDPTGGGRHGYVDSEGFVRGQDGGYAGWRAINFFPYAIFKPQTGSVSGIYIRLPKAFMTRDGRFDAAVYRIYWNATSRTARWAGATITATPRRSRSKKAFTRCTRNLPIPCTTWT
jgi:hypothetical protein